MPTISDAEAALVIKALDHYHAYLVATRREDASYKALAERLQRKGPEKEEARPTEKRKKA